MCKLVGDFERLLAHGLAHAERHPRRRIGDIFAKNQHRIGQLNIMERGRASRPRLKNIQHRRSRRHWSSATPAKKRSFPTSLRSAKLASSDALGEPMPIALPSETRDPQFPLRFIRGDGLPVQPRWREF